MYNIKLNIRDLYFNCTDSKEDRKIFLDNMMFVLDNYNKKIHNYTSYTPYDKLHFMHNLDYSIDNGLNIKVQLCSDDLLDGICKILEIDNSGLDEENTINLINQNIENLKSIKDKSLKNIYPLLHNMFIEGLGLYHKWSPMEFLDENNPEEKEIYDRLSKERSKYFSYGFRYSYSKFCEVQSDYFERLIRHKDDIKRYCRDKSNINDIYLNGLNKDKLNLYIFYKYLLKVEELDSSKDKIKLLNILSRLRINIIDIDENVTILNNINKTNLLAQFVISNRKYNIPKNITVDGAILPSSKDYDKKGNKVIRSYVPLTDEEREELIIINRKKKEFYNNSGYLTVISEKDNLTGNQAFVYPNGHILEDYIADEENDASLKRNKKNAIYHVDIYGFEDLLNMGKLEVRQDDRCHGYYMHTGEWVSRLQKVLDIESSDEVFEDTKKFIKKMENKKSSK